ncbi:hypothetical protein KFU94_28745 [Chloroflexi bacterium TSY]|nr:hypothetical protein [Chloroflexi bacterium TSY]
MQRNDWHNYLAVDESKPLPRVDRALLVCIYGYAKPHLFSVMMVLATIFAISLVALVPPCSSAT